MRTSPADDDHAAAPPFGAEREGYVFVSYKREEVEHARRIRSALQAAKFSVWWDEDIQCGQAWNEVIDKAVKDAGCIVVLWSERAMASRWVMHEASSAMERGVYAPVRIALCTIQSPYDRWQATDIVNWDGHAPHPGVERLLHRVNQLLPLRRTRLAVFRDWCQFNFSTIASILFALLALGLLVWQSAATREQMSQAANVTKGLTDLETRQKRMADETARRDESQRDERDKVRYWAVLQAEGAILELLTPYVEITGIPEVDDRFKIVASFSESDVFSGICNVTLHEKVTASALSVIGNGTLTWGEALTHYTNEGRVKLHSVIASYAGILPSETIGLMGSVTIHPWLEFTADSRNRELRHLQRNTPIPPEGITLCGPYSDKYRPLAQEFGRALAALETDIRAQYEALAPRLGRHDPPPLFYRALSGMKYIPSRKRAKE